MYKVFINEKVICFTNSIEKNKSSNKGLVLNFFSSEFIPIIIELFREDSKINSVIFEMDDFESAFSSFKSRFKLIRAAGGIVSNSNAEKLFIYRLDKWDLPKGKIEQNEGIESAAIREVEEECGVSELRVSKKLNDTFHIYELKNKLILKQTNWFEMETNFNGELIPQIEEDITQVEWLNDGDIKEKVLNNTYASIKELLSFNGY